ncbi:MAG: aminotransferase class I/II-fold pyridoxal phosphate-dependent enzyme [Chromatiales bacterium]|nr:aminotransferase class I/II-fold pyridoxal phosphate-dependent enzyme [Chromatiales bacterium]
MIHDLAYADIVFDGYVAPSILQVPGAKDIAVEFFTLSKSYNMPGWRVGFMVRQPDAGRGAGADEVLSRLRHVHADPGRRHRRAGRPAGLRRGDPRDVPASAATCCATA